MKKILLSLLVLLLPITACAERFQEGKHYTVVRSVASAEPEITEFFSVLCGHCYSFEPIVHELSKQLPPGVKFKRNHVDFVGRDIGPLYTRAYATMLVLKVEDTVLPAIFNEVHGKKNFLQTPAALRDFFIKNGVDAGQYDGAVSSFAVNGLVSQMQKATKDYKITGVPSFFVNGKYKINTSSIKSADEFVQLVLFLLEKK
ncbi:thiol:disulfide interchange protein DsbA/DsbL [Corallincola spongiicola]|uniref:Thiol:disulfide interchange protein n=1 Tax=Corallincola spongiicola TaxID=2520508 RepID=A0ABY1WL28_9GAMM|nr:thiol:disulfide interchange protein DsbA/DsbL [Corallincola spongiicola]TAA41036.1 thiol:disulfide interchange protein DsbA/DsbL [Corallincola spongiicola]